MGETKTPAPIEQPKAKGLYPALLGSAWNELAEPVRRAHGAGEWAGTFRVLPPANWLGRVFARWLRLPAPGEAVRVRLSVKVDGDRECWTRTFDRQPLVTRQHRDRHGRMIEQFAGLELRVQLRVQDGGLIYEQVGAALFRGWLRLPGFLAPRVVGSEMPDGAVAVRVSVRVAMPLVGLLIAYDGRLRV